MKAKYYSDPSLKVFSNLVVAKENKDGTVDLADDTGTVIVTSCPVTKEPTLGSCVLVKEAAAPKK
jgi:hypothetical protein